MIFVTVGAQLPFDRLIRAMDAWCERNSDREVFMQIGVQAWKPTHARSVEMMDAAGFADSVRRATIIVAHAGMGSIISALEAGKPIIVMPRLARLGEHRNDHQVGTARRFAERGKVTVAMDDAKLQTCLDHLDKVVASTPIKPFASDELVEALRTFIAATLGRNS